MRALILLLTLLAASPALALGPEALLAVLNVCPSVETGDTSNYLSAWISTNSANCQTYYWHAAYSDPDWTITIYSDAGHTSQVATGGTALNGTATLTGTLSAQVFIARDGGEGNSFSFDGTIIFPRH